MQWITRRRPKVDRIACPWLIKRFVDRDAEFLFVAPEEVKPTAERTGAHCAVERGRGDDGGHGNISSRRAAAVSV